MPPAGDFIRIQVDLGSQELRNYSILWSGTEFRVSTIVFGGKLKPHTRDVVRGDNLPEGLALFAARILEYLTTRHNEIASEVLDAQEMAQQVEKHPRPGFRPVFFKKQANAHARQFAAWKSNVSAQISEALRSAQERDWPSVEIRMPWSVADAA
jgi:hypothetical protein